MENSSNTQPTRLPWVAPQVYDLNSRHTEAGILEDVSEHVAHTNTSTDVPYYPPTS